MNDLELQPCEIICKDGTIKIVMAKKVVIKAEDWTNNERKNNMRLTDTVEMMNSTDYKERFRAEYYQLAIRYNGLKTMLEKWEDNALEFVPACNKGIYNLQIRAMGDYIACLETRAMIEGIEL